jgi:hypothetical protein
LLSGHPVRPLRIGGNVIFRLGLRLCECPECIQCGRERPGLDLQFRVAAGSADLANRSSVSVGGTRPSLHSSVRRFPAAAPDTLAVTGPSDAIPGIGP